MLTVTNREELTSCARVLPVIERLALCIFGRGRGISEGGIPETGAMVSAVTIEAKPSSSFGWIIFADDKEVGIGINLGDFVPNRTLLRQQINFVTYAQKLACCLAPSTDEWAPILRQDGSCPPSWRRFCATVRKECFMVATSLLPPPISFHSVESIRAPTKFALSLQGYLHWRGELSIGATQQLKQLPVTCTDQGLSGYLSISEEGNVKVMITEHEIDKKLDRSIKIRVDVGEIELTLEEISGLRAGSMVQLQANLPISCYLRIGSSTLGVGELAASEEGLRITLKEMIS